MRIIKILSVLLVVCLLASCSSIKHTASVAEVQTTVVNFTVADVNTNGIKVSKTTKWNYNPFRPVSVTTEIKNTEAKLLEESGCDILLEPQYIIEKRGFMRGGSVTVIGIPAKYSNFHKMTPEEAAIVSIMNEGSCKKNAKVKKHFIKHIF